MAGFPLPEKPVTRENDMSQVLPRLVQGAPAAGAGGVHAMLLGLEDKIAGILAGAAMYDYEGVNDVSDEERKKLFQQAKQRAQLSIQNFVQKMQKKHPNAFTTGEVAGSIPGINPATLPAKGIAAAARAAPRLTAAAGVPAILAGSTALAGEESEKAGKEARETKSETDKARERAIEAVGPDPGGTDKKGQPNTKMMEGESSRKYRARVTDLHATWQKQVLDAMDKDPVYSKTKEAGVAKTAAGMPYAQKYPDAASNWLTGALGLAAGLPVAGRLGELAPLARANMAVRKSRKAMQAARNASPIDKPALTEEKTFLEELKPKIQAREEALKKEPSTGREVGEALMAGVDSALIAGVPYERDLRAPEGSDAYNDAWRTINPMTPEFWTRMGAPGVGGAFANRLVDRALVRPWMTPVGMGSARARAAAAGANSARALKSTKKAPVAPTAKRTTYDPGDIPESLRRKKGD